MCVKSNGCNELYDLKGKGKCPSHQKLDKSMSLQSNKHLSFDTHKCPSLLCKRLMDNLFKEEDI